VRCRACSSPTQVVETRVSEGGEAVRRRRRCSSCERRFTTYERVESPRLYVRKRGGESQAFDPAKLRRALTRAAHKRPVLAEDVEAIVSQARERIEAAGGELDAGEIGELCLARLRELDAGAYLQFAGTLPQPVPELATGPAVPSGPRARMQGPREKAATRRADG
jgi:transcriptional repressor NrdR